MITDATHIAKQIKGYRQESASPSRMLKVILACKFNFCIFFLFSLVW